MENCISIHTCSHTPVDSHIARDRVVMHTGNSVRSKAHKALESQCCSVFMLRCAFFSFDALFPWQQRGCTSCKQNLDTPWHDYQTSTAYIVDLAAKITIGCRESHSCWDSVVCSLTAATPAAATGWHHSLLHTGAMPSLVCARVPYRASSCSGRRTRTPEEPWRNPPPSSPPTRTTACHWQQWTVEVKGQRWDTEFDYTNKRSVWVWLTRRPKYSKKKTLNAMSICSVKSS